MQLGSWLGVFPNGVETQLFVGGEITVAERVAPFAYGGIHRHANGSVELRDANVGVSWIPLWKPSAMIRVRPGLSIPSGGLTSGFLFTPLSSASVDPWLAVDWMAGSTWLVGGTVVSRVPIYNGWDKIGQGPFVRTDLRLSRRLGVAVPWLGVSGVAQAPSRPEGASPHFSELAAIAGSVISLHERWSLTAQLRVPLAVTNDAANQASGGLALRFVVGNRGEEKEEEEDDGHGHGEDDGHGHGEDDGHGHSDEQVEDEHAEDAHEHAEETHEHSEEEHEHSEETHEHSEEEHEHSEEGPQ